MPVMRRCSAIENRTVYIPQIDGKDLWISNYGVCDGELNGYSTVNKKGENNYKKFKASFDYSLDSPKLKEVYQKVYRNTKFSHIHGKKEFTSRVINVTSEYSVRAWNRVGSNTYIRLNASAEKLTWEGRIGKRNNQICGVLINTEFDEQVHLKEPLDVRVENYTIDDLFQYKDGKFIPTGRNPVISTVKQIRKKLYDDGFMCDGIKYRRWKRSSGSSRVGKCLFVDEALYNRIHKWENCGLKIKENDIIDLAAYEAYISLTSSSIIDTLTIYPENILVVDDYESCFYNDVINVTEHNGKLDAKREKTKIRNSIFDGQSLLDISAFGEIYQDKGMLLLRNRFFKSCCFNSNIQKWFHDNAITNISQINGTTLATKIEDIKLITTPSSIKYLKFGTLEQWLSLLEDDFGIVKYEKPTHFLNGDLVQTHYQLINSIQIHSEEMIALLKPTFQFMDLIKKEPSVLRSWIKFQIEDEVEISPVKSKTDVIYKMMSVNEDFCKTKFYHDFVSDFLKSFTKDLKCGHVLVNGNYSTLCGNPIEMLKQSIGIFDGKSCIDRGTICSKRFSYNQTLLGSRSPHITMSNVLLSENKQCKLIDDYMNATDGIVYINSIEENILQQLAGCDYDSDSLLLTDNSILIGATKRNYGHFPIAVCNVGGKKVQRRYNSEDLADLDDKTSKNLIGDIINCSQELNSLIWNIINSKVDYKYGIDEIYLDICKLSIMSNIEIDKAKKEFDVDTGKELSAIRRKYKLESDDGKTIKPYFFAHITKNKNKMFYNPEKKKYQRFETSMDTLQHCVNTYRSKKSNKTNKLKFVPFSEIILFNGFTYKNVSDKQINEVLSSVDNLNQYLKMIYQLPYLSKQEKYLKTQNARQEFVEKIGTMCFNRDTMIALLQTIEKNENRKYARLLFYTLFGYPNTSFYQVVKESESAIPYLEQEKNGNISFFQHKYIKKYTKKPQKQPPSKN